MAALVAAGGHRLQLGIAWHPQVWTGRARPRSFFRSLPGDVRRPLVKMLGHLPR